MATSFRYLSLILVLLTQALQLRNNLLDLDFNIKMVFLFEPPFNANVPNL